MTIVVALDIGEQVAPGGISIGVFALMDELGFQRAKEALHRGVVPAVSLTAHRLGDTGGLQDIPIVDGGVLGGFKRSSQRGLCRLIGETGQAPLRASSNQASFVAAS